MGKKSFVHLHVHSEFSALDGASRVGDLVKKAASTGMPALAITDHGMMNSLVSFYSKARSAGVKPIVGCEVYVSPKSRFDRIKMGEGEKNAYHMVLLAKNAIGAKNLNILCSRAHLEGYYYKPRIDDELLAQHSEGLIALSACLGGRIPQHLLKSEFEKAKEAALFYKAIFGDDFYLELQDHGDPQQLEINKLMIQICNQTGIELVATNDSHFTNREDRGIHDILLMISTGATVSKPNKLYYSDHHYFKTPEEMWQIEIFAAHQRALLNTIEIANKCNYILELGVNHLPDFPVPDGHTQASYLREITHKGLERRYDHITEEIRSRADFELDVIEKMGFPGYLLIVWDYINWAKEQGIPVGPGRGSAAGSIICFAIGITDIDPLPNGLLFERFLNPERVSMPDIDVDFCINRRQEVMNYVARKYGEDKVCQIATFGTMKAKAAFKDVARVMELPYDESNRLTKLMGKELDLTLEGALEIEDFRLAIENNPKAKEIYETAKKLEGTVRGLGTHAAGVIISKYKLEEVTPLMRVSKEATSSDEDSGDNIPAAKLSSQTQLELKDAEAMGLIKMDFLGLRNLTMIDHTIKLIKKNHGIDIDWHSPELRGMDDPKVYQFISSGKTMGLFQIEGDGITKLVVKMRPTFFGDLSAILALYRPGPLESKMDELYVDCKHGRKEVEYPHIDLKPYLEDTYGTMIYQEQIMQIAQTMAGYTLGQADMLRRAMGKKKPEEMAKQKDIFINGAIEKGYQPGLAESTFEKMAKFAEYGFNRAHSAAYAVITYRTAWLKTYYPAEFMAALMTSLSGDNDKILKAVRECEKMGIQVLPPDVNYSDKDFAVVEGHIRFGMLSIKGIGEDFVESIVDQRAFGGKFESLFDFCKRVKHKTYNARSLASLVKAGAFDTLERNRASLIATIDDILPNVAKEQKNASAGQVSLFGDNLSTFTTPSGLVNVAPFCTLEELEFERELMGIYVSSHPLKATGINVDLHTSHNVVELDPSMKGQHVVLCAILRSVKNIITKKNDPMAFLKLEDMGGVIDAVCFPKAYMVVRDSIVDNRRLQIFGTVGIDKDGQVQVIIERVRDLDGLQSLHLRLPADLDDASLLAIERMLPQFKGDTPIVFEYDNSNQLVVAGPQFWVSYSEELVRNLESVVGNGRVRIV